MTIEPDAQRLFDKDLSASLLGIELVEATPDRSVVQMTVTEQMCNGFGIGHGGITFLLADSAMAFASNAEGGTALATSATIDWLAPVRVGDLLTATCQRHHGQGRSRMWRITVTNGADDEVAALTGRTRRVGG